MNCYRINNTTRVAVTVLNNEEERLFVKSIFYGRLVSTSCVSHAGHSQLHPAQRACRALQGASNRHNTCTTGEHRYIAWSSGQLIYSSSAEPCLNIAP